MKRLMTGPDLNGLIPPKTKCKYHGNTCFDHSCPTQRRENSAYSCGIARSLKLMECALKNISWRPLVKMELEDHEFKIVDLKRSYTYPNAERLVRKLKTKFKYYEFKVM